MCRSKSCIDTIQTFDEQYQFLFQFFKKNYPMYAIISLHRNYALAVCKNVVVHCVYVRREVYHVFRMTSEMFPGKCIGRAMFKRKSLNHHKIAGKIQNGVKLQIFLKKTFHSIL